MSYAIVFSSKTGNTQLLADTLHNFLPQAECCYFGNPNPAAMEGSGAGAESRYPGRRAGRRAGPVPKHSR